MKLKSLKRSPFHICHFARVCDRRTDSIGILSLSVWVLGTQNGIAFITTLRLRSSNVSVELDGEFLIDLCQDLHFARR